MNSLYSKKDKKKKAKEVYDITELVSAMEKGKKRIYFNQSQFSPPTETEAYELTSKCLSLLPDNTSLLSNSIFPLFGILGFVVTILAMIFNYEVIHIGNDGIELRKKQ